MLYVYFFLQLIILSLLSPFRWGFNFVVRNLWMNLKFNVSNPKHTPKTELSKFAKQTRKKLVANIDEITRAGDSAKFVSMLLVATNDKNVLEVFKSYIKDGKFFRKPNLITKKAQE